MAVDVVVVGGGPAGAVTALLLARRGIAVEVLERAPAWRWRACGVFTSPATVTALRRLGFDEATLARVARPLAAMRVETRRGTDFRLTYGGTGNLADSAVGLDRSALDPLLLELAAGAGAVVRPGVAATAVRVDARGERPTLQASDGSRLAPRIVVGADGLRSVVAAAAGVARRSPLGVRAGLTFHVPQEQIAEDPVTEARMVVIDDGYVGLAPVPGGRVNVGIVLGGPWFGRLRQHGARAVAVEVADGVRPAGVRGSAGTGPDILDHVAGASPLGVAAARRAGRDWLLVGDAAGFLDPFTGEGLHRALASAELAADAIEQSLAGGPEPNLAGYDAAMRARFGRKDHVSRLVQAFLGRPALFEYAARRLAAREDVRETMALVIGDLAPASRALDPRYLAALLAP